MAALQAGTKAPDISLAAVDGSTFSLQEALKKGPVFAAFFKGSSASAGPPVVALAAATCMSRTRAGNSDVRMSEIAASPFVRPAPSGCPFRVVT